MSVSVVCASVKRKKREQKQRKGVYTLESKVKERKLKKGRKGVAVKEKKRGKGITNQPINAERYKNQKTLSAQRTHAKKR